MDHKQAMAEAIIDYLEMVLTHFCHRTEGEEMLAYMLEEFGVRSEVTQAGPGYWLIDHPAQCGRKLEPFIPETALEAKYSYEAIQKAIRNNRNGLLSAHLEIVELYHASSDGADGGSEAELTYKPGTTPYQPRSRSRQNYTTQATVNQDESLSPARKAEIHREHVESRTVSQSTDTSATRKKRSSIAPAEAGEAKTRPGRGPTTTNPLNNSPRPNRHGGQSSRPKRGAPTSDEEKRRQAYKAASRTPLWKGDDSNKAGNDFQPGGD